MASSEERRRILDLLAAGKVNADQAASLLKALGPTPAESLPRPPAPRPAEEPQRWQKAYEAAVHAAAERTRGPGGRPRFVRIRIEASKSGGKNTNVDVRVPYALAKFALRFLPQEARKELEAQGIDIAQLLEGADGSTPQGNIVNVEAADPGGDVTHINIEVI